MATKPKTDRDRLIDSLFEACADELERDTDCDDWGDVNQDRGRGLRTAIESVVEDYDVTMIDNAESPDKQPTI